MKKLIVICIGFISLVWAGFSQTLGTALDNANLTWTTSSQIPAGTWSGESTNFYYGGAAAVSGNLFNSTTATSTLQTTVTGPGTLAFWWKVSSGSSASSFGALLTFKVGNVQKNAIQDNVDWQQQTVYLPAGSQTLQWVSSQTSFQYPATGYVDDVTWTTGSTAPTIVTEPAGQSEIAGLNATFHVSVVGTPPFAYQWRFNGINISAATNAAYIVTNVQSVNLGNYDVVITNSVGTNYSSLAPLVLGQITGWGDSSFGETFIPANTTNALMIAGSLGASFILNPDRTVTAWGNNATFITNLPVGLTNVIALSAGINHCLALKADGTLMAWGTNYYGETVVPPGLSNVVAVAAGDLHSLVLQADGTVIAWGLNTIGQTNVPVGLTNVVAISAGTDFSVALCANGTVAAWGENFSGQTKVPADLTNAVAITSGPNFSAALRADGTVVTWGGNYTSWTNVPTGLSNVVALSAYGYLTAALKADGTVKAWGNNSFGATNIPSGLTNVVMLGIGWYHALAVTGNGNPVIQNNILNPNCSTNGFGLTIPTQCGHVYRLEYQSNLGDSNWTSLPMAAGNGTNLVLADPCLTASQRFYRVRRW